MKAGGKRWREVLLVQDRIECLILFHSFHLIYAVFAPLHPAPPSPRPGGCMRVVVARDLSCPPCIVVRR